MLIVSALNTGLGFIAFNLQSIQVLLSKYQCSLILPISIRTKVRDLISISSERSLLHPKLGNTNNHLYTMAANKGSIDHFFGRMASETRWESMRNVGIRVDVMSNFLEVAIVSTNQVTKVKQLNTKQLAKIQFDYGF
ncbi:hypothetical protein Pan241w_59300 [Gimesia alba]|uniref:Uncharacterized protein n=1 Tax=Gimesia alba TaxID=2527973 RepID=A0A517RPP0_9PLAN|nr:hypothetical protein [Gimesia alba]QDT45802.1 hypothetical protein Pan241w_59300 [Gimesia alba]